MELNKIYNMDCVEGMRMLPDNSIDITVTSPPYDNLRTYNGFEWDFEATARELYRVTKQGGVVVWIVGDATIKGSETGSSFKQALYFKECGFNLHDTMIWQKTSPFTHKNRYIACFEYMFVFSKSKPKSANIICDRKNKWAGTAMHGTQRLKADGVLLPNNGIRAKRLVKEYGARYNIWDMPGDKTNKTGHPAVFPEQLARDHILSWSNVGDTVLDPFVGSGTTALAALISGRNYIGFDISKEYCEIARKRLDTTVIQLRNRRVIHNG
jgi:site-specific DNA-methyltransferase (adenine-specific)